MQKYPIYKFGNDLRTVFLWISKNVIIDEGCKYIQSSRGYSRSFYDQLMFFVRTTIRALNNLNENER